MPNEDISIEDARKLFSEKFQAAFQEKQLNFRDVSHSTKIMPEFVEALMQGASVGERIEHGR